MMKEIQEKVNPIISKMYTDANEQPPSDSDTPTETTPDNGPTIEEVD